MSSEETEPNEVKKIPKKGIKRSLKKKPLIAGGIIAVIAIAGIVSGIVLLGEIGETRRDTLVLGVTGTLNYLDPMEGWGEESSAIITQVVTEALFALEFINNRTEIIPNLATGYNWSTNKTELKLYLRKNVEFHDDTPFNAAAVKWNIDRLHRLIDLYFSGIAYQWQLPDGNWIINETKVLDEYTVKFVLNQPFIPLLSLLATVPSLMLSPSSTPDNEFNTLISGTIYGTGAFIYSAYEGGNNVTLSPNPDYWGGRPAFDDVIIKFYPNDTVKYEAMLSGELSNIGVERTLSDEDKDLFMNTAGIELEGTLAAQPAMNYIFMNNKVINATMRKAISYAFNFSAYANIDIMGKPVSSWFPIRSESPIPKAMPYSHWGSFDMPYYNISIARQALKDANWPGTAGLTANDTINPGNEWEMVANSLTPLATYNYTFPIDNWWNNSLYHLLNESLKQIGVKLEQTPNMTFYELNTITADKFGIHRAFAWGADYNDPASMINPLFSSKADGGYNVGQVNDALVQQWMEEALEETNETVREQLYFNIEKRLIEEVYPVIWIESLVYYEAHVSNLHWTPDLGVFTIKDWYFD
ncbi:hypothetical protein LCGC14_1313420 [marine sediment metagenome]|uniref:Solute-binding protein family 5 domain-containing protein n=1 Tax=marine sediment metagenome TaxID=412755 RepID=A0A0F9L6T1_9ZZZZ